MSQTAYNLSLTKAFAGMKGDSRFDLVESIIAFAAVQFGRGLMSYAGETDCNMAMRDVATVTTSADFVAGDSVITTVNGVATASIAYATTHAAQLAAILAAVQALSTVHSATSASTGHGIITIRTKGSVAVVTAPVVNGGQGTAANVVESTTASATNMKFKGLSVHRNCELGYILANEIVDVMRRGVVWCATAVGSSAIAVDDVAYVDLAGGTGLLTNLSTNNLATGGVFKSSLPTTAAGIAAVEINLP